MHTAVEVGFWGHPWTLALCQAMGCPLAGAHVLRLRELVLAHGTSDGRLPGHTLEEISAACGWKASPKKFAAVMSRWLGRRRGTWCYQEWNRSQTGRYAALKEWDRNRHLEERKARKKAALEKIANGGGAVDENGECVRRHPVDARGSSADVHSDLGIKKERRVFRGTKNGAPEAPEGGERDAARLGKRWEWFSTTHPKLRDPDACKRMLDGLTVPEWEHLCYALPKLAAGIYVRKGYRWIPYADKFLRKKAFVEVPMPNPAELAREKKAEKAAKKAPPKPTAAEEAATRKAAAEKFLLAALADPELSAAEKERAKDRWAATWKSKPWEGA